jgi:hypothetical protein
MSLMVFVFRPSPIVGARSVECVVEFGCAESWRPPAFFGGRTLAAYGVVQLARSIRLTVVTPAQAGVHVGASDSTNHKMLCCPPMDSRLRGNDGTFDGTTP